MVTLTLVHPGHDAAVQPVTVVIICQDLLVRTSAATGQVRTATVREAFSQGRIPYGTTMDHISREIALSPTLFHEMFHAAMGVSGSKLSLVNMD
jgi:hypothetical protein